MSINDQQHTVAEYFRKHFGTTPLNQRLQDIHKEAGEVLRWTDIAGLKDEMGDLLATLLAGINECGFEAEALLEQNKQKIERRSGQYAALGRKTKVAILGGAFNPITLGHIAVAKLVLQATGAFDECWVMPCHRHLYNKDLTDAKHRLAMCKIAASSDPRIKVFPFEIDGKLSGETYHLVKKLLDDPMAETHSYSLIIGMDNANTFDKWVNFSELERMIQFVIVPRPGEEADPKVTWYKNGHHIVLQPENPLPDTSSTRAKECLKAFWRCHKMKAETTGLINAANAIEIIGQPVFDYIFENKLYTGENGEQKE